MFSQKVRHVLYGHVFTVVTHNNHHVLQRYQLGFHIRLLEVIFAGFYMYAPQGRPLAIEQMELQSVGNLLAEHVALSPHLKTQSKYGYQPVILPVEIQPLVEFYLLRLRVAAAARSHLHNSMLPTHPMWLYFDGKGPVNISSYVTHFFEVHLGTHTTPTMIRSLVETHAQEAMDQNLITPSQARSIGNINGHSGAVVNDYYIRRSLQRDADAGLTAFRNMTNQGLVDDVAVDVVATNTTTAAQDMYSFGGGDATRTSQQWGSRHPDQTKPLAPGVRFQWTDSEIQYVGEWCTKYITAHPHDHTFVVSKCLAAIRSDAAAVPIFHRSHIMNTVRLKHGLLMYNKQLKL